ncbi:MAG: hypothetical protein JXA09_00695 [Anaerolineae bacterium]|nr:hypothetical protein [Anaerolineae bacterium]
MDTRVIQTDPRRLVLLKQNARFMRHEVFQRLVDNLRQDGALTQLPFCAILDYHAEGDPIPRHEDGTPVYEVLSGNHRVRAAIVAGFAAIVVQVTDEPLPPDRRKAIQLSHNAISGEDDPAILAAIYDSIQAPSMRVYSGLDDDRLGLLNDVAPDSIAEANLSFQTISMTFLPDEVAAVRETWEAARAEVAGSKEVWLARWAEYDRALDALEAASDAYGVRNTATALLLVLEVFTRHATDLAEGWLDGEGEAKRGAGRVPVASIFGTHKVAARDGATLKRVVDRMLSEKLIEGDDRWQAMVRLADAYLEG